jgi:hypothetical protein
MTSKRKGSSTRRAPETYVVRTPICPVVIQFVSIVMQMQNSMIECPQGRAILDGHRHGNRRVRNLRPPRDHDTHGWKPFLTAQEIQKVVIVALTSWVFAVVTLVYNGRFNPILFLVCVGFITLLLSLTSGLCVLIARVIQEQGFRSK